MTIFRCKPLSSIHTQQQDQQLKRCLRWPHLVALGVGAIIGSGIYTLIGVGAHLAGPGLLLSFLVAGGICACAALAYAEMATLIPVAGSTYTYSYVTLGEPIAWIIGWSLILEYTLVVSTAAVGWSGYFVGFINWLQSAFHWNLHLPVALLSGPGSGGVINLPAVCITALVTCLLLRGIRESATLNAFLVVSKITALILFVIIAFLHFKLYHLTPFMPYGFLQHEGPDNVKYGVMAASAIVFFAFYGFDALSTAAEETQNPGRNLSIGIIGSMVGCMIIYVLVSLAALGAVSFEEFSRSAEPLAFILQRVGSGWASAIIGIVAVVALPTVLLAFLYGQSRIFFVMARDGLLPQSLASVHPKSGMPVKMTVLTAVFVASLAAFARLDEIAALANAGTLIAFIAVSVCLLVLRVRAKELHRPFRAPCAWLIAPVAIGGCLYLFCNLPTRTQIGFAIWNLIGLSAYFAYGRRHSLCQY